MQSQLNASHLKMNHKALNKNIQESNFSNTMQSDKMVYMESRILRELEDEYLDQLGGGELMLDTLNNEILI